VSQPDRLTPGIVVTALAIAAAVTAAVLASIALRDTIWFIEIDFKVYHMSGSAVLDGVSPFDVATEDGFLFIYPPIAALMFVPFALMNVHVAFAVWTFLTVLALEAAIWLALGFVERSPGRRARYALLATVVALPTAQVIMNVTCGQVNVLLMLLVLADLARRPGRFQGAAIGIAAGLKLTPLIFVVYLLLTRRVRAAAVAAATFASTVLVGFLVLPGPSGQWWGELMLATERMMPPGTAPYIQSIRAGLSQLPGVLSATWFWVVLATVVGVAGLAIASWFGRRGMEAVGIMACAVTGLLISPVSWVQHWVWLVPGLTLWLWWARRRDSAGHTAGVALAWLVMVTTGVLFFVLVARVLVLPTAGIAVMSAVPVLAGLGFLGTLAVVRRRLAHRPERETALSA
jgi:alpha-1,2-mannosyltransferase